MKKNILIFAFIIGTIQMINAQETDEEWKTQTHVTGYFALNCEYVDLPVFKEVKGRNIGMNIGEASILSTIRPLEKFKINSVITYKPRLGVNRIIAELSGEWNFSDAFNLKGGRFILPLDPANTQYFAPLNYGVLLPTVVTSALFPLNINGINFNGKASLSDNISLCYNFSGGQYTKLSRIEAGILGFSGRDGVYMSENVQQVDKMIAKIESMQSGEYPDFFGTATKIHLEINDIVKFGIASFYGAEKASLQANDTTFYKTDLDFLSYGTNLVVNYNNLYLSTSVWLIDETPDDTQHFVTYNSMLCYGEMAYTLGKVMPFVKYEYIDSRKKYNRVTAGINYRPFFETTFKVEYHRYLQDYIDDFNVFMLSAVYSF